MNPIGTALLGFGYAGRTFHAPLIAAATGLKLQVVVSSDPARVRADCPQVRVCATLAEALADPSIALVVIATPNALHAAQAREALLAGRHVVVDKPFTVTRQEAEDLIALAQARSRVLSVFHNRRWDGDFLTLQALLDSGRLGRVVALESRFDRFRPIRRARWREQAVAGGGIWYDLGPHLVDQAVQLFGRPLRVHGELAGLRDEAEVDDWAEVQLDYGQCKVTLSASMLVGGGLPRFAMHGTAGSWIKFGLDAQESQLLAGLRPADREWGHDRGAAHCHAGGAPQPHPSARGCYQSYYQALALAIAGSAPNPVPADQALEVMTVIEAAFSSARSGSWTRLDGTTAFPVD
jgi:predicted dehydrogenase